MDIQVVKTFSHTLSADDLEKIIKDWVVKTFPDLDIKSMDVDIELVSWAEPVKIKGVLK